MKTGRWTTTKRARRGTKKSGSIRLIFAGRLVSDKGVSVLLAAIDQARTAGADLEITIIGVGPLRDECIRAARDAQGAVRVRYLDPVPYGAPFLEVLRGHDAVLVPSLSDEQPRILYDAFSQAVPVIGSATGGILEVAEHEVTGRLLPPDDAGALAGAPVWASTNRARLRTMGMAALGQVRRMTHRAMHRDRHDILLRTLPEYLKR